MFQNSIQMNFYDNYHVNPRFSILFEDVEEKIYLEFRVF